MVFYGTTLNGAFFRKYELQIAASLWLYCKNADGTYADAELIGEIILDMRKISGSPPPCQGIETFLRDSDNLLHQEAWREVQVNDAEWREKAEAAYWSWRNNKTELVERLISRGEFVRSTAVKGYDQCLEEIGAESRKRESQGKHGKVFANYFVGNLKFLPDSMQLGPEL